MKIKRMNEKAIEPHYSTIGSSAFDLFCYEDVVWENISGVHYATVKTGWAFDVPHEHALFVFSRSGHGFKHGISLANSVGVVDYDFKSEVMVRLQCKLNVPHPIRAGTAIAQGIIMETPRVFFEIVNDLKETSHSGFGSTGM